ncbi:hypothetical protein LTR74_013262 [Friedmanniomyces endolithicus]|nr:hypothetical protein LTR74_013262 [Friedmanniomyces endolithicus]
MHQNPETKTSPPMYQPVNVTTIPPVSSQPQRVAPMMTPPIPLATTLGTPQNTTKTKPLYFWEDKEFSFSTTCFIIYGVCVLLGIFLAYRSSLPNPPAGGIAPIWPYLSIILSAIISLATAGLVAFLETLVRGPRAELAYVLLGTSVFGSAALHALFGLVYSLSDPGSKYVHRLPSFWVSFCTLCALLFAVICLAYVRPVEIAVKEEAEEARRASKPAVIHLPQRLNV